MDDVHSDQTVIVAPGNVPAFLLKLWNILENPAYSKLISWNQNGKTIKIHDQNEFTSEILPRYYKHNNFSSFVRQINIYGFHKIVDSDSRGLKEEHPEWEFFHNNFQRGKPEELHLIKRKVNVKEEQHVRPQLRHLLLDVEKLKNQHTAVQDKLNLMKMENELLWRELSDLRDQHHNVINKLIQFITKIMDAKTDLGRKRKALALRTTDSKIARTQDAQLYNPQATDMVQLCQESYNDLPSDYLVEPPPDTIELVQEAESPQFKEVSTMTLISMSNILSPNSLENRSIQEAQPSFVYSITTSVTVATPSLTTAQARIKSIPSSSIQIQSKLPVRKPSTYNQPLKKTLENS